MNDEKIKDMIAAITMPIIQKTLDDIQPELKYRRQRIEANYFYSKKENQLIIVIHEHRIKSDIFHERYRNMSKKVYNSISILDTLLLRIDNTSQNQITQYRYTHTPQGENSEKIDQ